MLSAKSASNTIWE